MSKIIEFKDKNNNPAHLAEYVKNYIEKGMEDGKKYRLTCVVIELPDETDGPEITQVVTSANMNCYALWDM